MSSIACCQDKVMTLSEMPPEVQDEFCAIASVIEGTSKSLGSEYSWRDVREYHSTVKARIDSGKVIPVGSEPHRIAHHMMWYNGFALSNGFKDYGEVMAFICQNKGNPRADLLRKNAEYQASRFTIWYAQIYLSEQESPDKKIPKWVSEERAKAGRDARNVFNQDLEKVVIAVD